MAEGKKAEDKGNEYFILVPKVGAQVPNIQIIAYQEVPKTENGVQVAPAVTKMLSPNGQGLFILPKDAPDHERCMKAMEVFQTKRNKEGAPPVLIGPFNTQAEAFKEMHAVRPKTDSERANEALAKSQALEAENEAKAKELEAKDAELAELRKKLAEAKK